MSMILYFRHMYTVLWVNMMSFLFAFNRLL